MCGVHHGQPGIGTRICACYCEVKALRSCIRETRTGMGTQVAKGLGIGV
jgi:hypothetical protein